MNLTFLTTSLFHFIYRVDLLLKKKAVYENINFKPKKYLNKISTIYAEWDTEKLKISPVGYSMWLMASDVHWTRESLILASLSTSIS